MRIATAHLNYKPKNDEKILNITRGSGTKFGIKFAPDWEHVMGSKSGKIKWEDYTSYYFKLLNDINIAYPQWFRKLLNEERPIVAVCYCDKPQCHRYLFVQWLLNNFPEEVEYLGELK